MDIEKIRKTKLTDAEYSDLKIAAETWADMVTLPRRTCRGLIAEIERLKKASQESLKSKTKYDVGDVLKPIIDDSGLVKLHVVEVLTQKCPAMIQQVMYRVRVYTQQFEGSAPTMTARLFEVNEIEVEMFTTPE